jgi:prolyl-tRNA synthetase
MKGVPLRVKFGPKDPAKDVINWARRETGDKGTLPLADAASKVPELLETIQQALYDKADKSFREHRLQITEGDKAVPASTRRT